MLFSSTGKPDVVLEGNGVTLDASNEEADKTNQLQESGA